MSLETRIKDALTAIGADIKALFGRALPTGGIAGQALVKTGAADFAVGWQNIGGSAPAWSSVEIDLGPPARQCKIFVPVPGMTAAAVVEAARAVAPATGKGSDEHEAEPVSMAAFPRTDGFDLIVAGIGTSIGGPMNIHYRSA